MEPSLASRCVAAQVLGANDIYTVHMSAGAKSAKVMSRNAAAGPAARTG